MKNKKFKVVCLHSKVELWVGSSKRLARKVAKKWSNIVEDTEVVVVRFCFDLRRGAGNTRVEVFASGDAYQAGKPDRGWIPKEVIQDFNRC